MDVEIELHSVDDWEALYINGKCHDQSHRERLEEWMFGELKTPVTIKSVKRVWHEGDAVDEYAMNTGGLPQTLEELYALFE